MRGATKGFLEYGRAYCGAVTFVGAQAVTEASKAPAPIV